MNGISRRDALKAAATAAIGLAASPATSPASYAATPLAEAVRRFNERAGEDQVGKHQPPLTVDEVVAAVRWTLRHAHEGNAARLGEGTRRQLADLAENGSFPADFELEKANGYEPDDRVVFTVWSIRIRVPSSAGGTTCVTVREQMIASRVMGDEERKFLAQWREKERARGGIGSFERAEWMHKYRNARDEAIERDRGGRSLR